MAFYAKYQSTVANSGEDWTVTIYYDTGSAPAVTTLLLKSGVSITWDHTGNSASIGIMPSFCRLVYNDPNAVLYDDLLASSDETLWRVEISRTGQKWRGFIQLSTPRKVLGTTSNTTELYAYCGLANLSNIEGAPVVGATERQIFEQVKYILSDSLLSDSASDPDVFLATEYVPDNMDTTAGTWADLVRLYEDWNRPYESSRNDAKTDLNNLCGLFDAMVWQGLDGWHFESVNVIGTAISNYKLNKYDLSADSLSAVTRSATQVSVTLADIQDGSILYVTQRIGQIVVNSSNLFASGSGLVTYSELPNGDLEEWNGSVAVGWSGTYNQTTKSNSGTYAARIEGSNSISRFGMVVSKDESVFPKFDFYYGAQYTDAVGSNPAVLTYKIIIHGLDGTTWYYQTSGGWTETDSARSLTVDTADVTAFGAGSVTYFQKTFTADAFDIPVSGYMEVVFIGTSDTESDAYYDDIIVTLVDSDGVIVFNKSITYPINDNGQVVTVSLAPYNMIADSTKYLGAYDGSNWNESAGVDGDGKPHQYIVASNIKARMLNDTSALEGVINNILPPEKPVLYDSVNMIGRRISINLNESMTSGEWRGYV